MQLEEVHTLHVSHHPLVADKLAIMRNEQSPMSLFHRMLYELSLLLATEATQNIMTEPRVVKTPLAEVECQAVSQSPVIVPILRAGLGMLEAFKVLMPTAAVGHIGLARDEQTLEPQSYYCKLPKPHPNQTCFLVDPMLATGGSAVAAINTLIKANFEHIVLVCVVAAPEGVRRVYQAHPNVPIYVAAVDDSLNDSGYIVPGLGDAGDRLFGTVEGHV